jgi:hypothetical protein
LAGRIIAWFLATSIAIQTPAPSIADRHWLDQFREAALDALMPVTSTPKPLVAYRSHRDLYDEVQERYFSVSFADGLTFDRNRLMATVVVPTGRSIQQQLLDGHMRDRQASFQSLVPQIVVRRVTFSAERCPAIRTRLDMLSKVALSLPERDVFVLHPFLHRIMIDMGGTHIDATISDEDNPLVRWASETTDAILACSIG